MYLQERVSATGELFRKVARSSQPLHQSVIKGPCEMKKAIRSASACGFLMVVLDFCHATKLIRIIYNKKGAWISERDNVRGEGGKWRQGG